MTDSKIDSYKIAEIELPNPARPADYWSFIPGLALAALVWFVQGARRK
jgi:Domain of unknown function (DUF3394)